MRDLVDRGRVMNDLFDAHPIGFNNDDISDAFKNAPTIDAVEVVRCKDCIWYQSNWIMEQDVCGRIMHNALRVSPNFFCQRGEREEDNNGKDN